MSPAPPGGRPAPVSDTSKLLAALSYPLWIPVAIIALLIEPYKTEGFVRFHAVQSIGLGLAAWIVSIVVGMVPFLGWVVSPLLAIGLLVYEILLAIKAYNGEYFEVPVVYGFVSNYVD